MKVLVNCAEFTFSRLRKLQAEDFKRFLIIVIIQIYFSGTFGRLNRLLPVRAVTFSPFRGVCG